MRVLWLCNLDWLPVNVTSQHEWDVIFGLDRIIEMICTSPHWKYGHIVAALSPYSGLWLHVLRISSLWNLLSPEEICVSVTHQMSAKLLYALNMIYVGNWSMSLLLTHFCVCLQCPMEIDDIIKWALLNARVQLSQEAFRSQKWWSNSKSGFHFICGSSVSICYWTALLWICFRPAIDCVVLPGAAGNMAEDLKNWKCISVTNNYIFQPIALWTGGYLDKLVVILANRWLSWQTGGYHDNQVVTLACSLSVSLQALFIVYEEHQMTGMNCLSFS